MFPQQNWQDMRVLVTAAGTGIGHTIATTFADHGARVHIYDVVADRLTELETAVPTINSTLADVSQTDQVYKLFYKAVDQLGGLDVLINNAGIAGPTAPVVAVTPAEWDQTLAVNINGLFKTLDKP